MKLKLTLSMLLLAAIALAADAAGKWTGSVPGQDGQETVITFNFKVDGPKLTGSVTTPMGDAPIVDGAVDGDNVTFSTEFNDMKIVHKGKISGDSMNLDVTMGDNNFKMALKRAAS